MLFSTVSKTGLVLADSRQWRCWRKHSLGGRSEGRQEVGSQVSIREDPNPTPRSLTPGPTLPELQSRAMPPMPELGEPLLHLWEHREVRVSTPSTLRNCRKSWAQAGLLPLPTRPSAHGRGLAPDCARVTALTFPDLWLRVDLWSRMRSPFLRLR